MVAAHQTGQIEGLGGGVQGHGAHCGVFTDGLGGDVLVAEKKDVAPDFIGDNHHIMLAVQFHRLLHFPLFPNSAAGVVGRAENGSVDFVLQDFLLHVGKVHPPDTVSILDQRRMDETIAIAAQGLGEAQIGGGVNQNLVSPGAEHIQSRDDTAQNAVLVANVRFGQTGNTIVTFLPADDGIKVFLSWVEVAKGGVLNALNHRLLNSGNHRKVHICHPHGNAVKPRFRRRVSRAGSTDHIHSDGILSPAVQNGSEIIFHGVFPRFYLSSLGRNCSR